MKSRMRMFPLVASITVAVLGCADTPSGPNARTVQPTGQAALDAVTCRPDCVIVEFQ